MNITNESHTTGVEYPISFCPTYVDGTVSVASYIDLPEYVGQPDSNGIGNELVIYPEKLARFAGYAGLKTLSLVSDSPSCMVTVDPESKQIYRYRSGFYEGQPISYLQLILNPSGIAGVIAQNGLSAHDAGSWAKALDKIVPEAIKSISEVNPLRKLGLTIQASLTTFFGTRSHKVNRTNFTEQDTALDTVIDELYGRK